MTAIKRALARIDAAVLAALMLAQFAAAAAGWVRGFRELLP